MATAKIYFSGMIQDSQEFGSNDEHMVSRVFFSVSVDGRTTNDVHVNVKQTVGSSFDDGPLEVSAPVGYSGPMNHEALSNAVENYYRSLVGSRGSGIRIAGASQVRMKNNAFRKPGAAEFQVVDEGRAW